MRTGWWRGSTDTTGGRSPQPPGPRGGGRPGGGGARQGLNGRVRRSSSLETIYCAELVATTYQHMGLLPKHRPASWYDPGAFWSGDRIALVPPFGLTAEIPVNRA